MTDLADVTLAVLAGGESSRMGRPKAELLLDGKPILRALLERLDWPGPTLLVTAPGRERLPGADRFTRECVDAVPGQGPLRGLLTALENTTTATLVLTAVDMPLVRREQLAWLVARLAEHGDALGLMPVRGRPAVQIEPFPSAFRREALGVVRRALDAHLRALHTLADDASIHAVPAPDDWTPDTWTNLNRPADLAAFGGRIG